MLLASYELLLDDPASFLRLAVLVALSLVVAVTVHEFSHALVANSLGDNTAKHQGRLTLNPVKHLDPSGTLMMLVAGFGWGKPVPVNPHRLAHGVSGTSLVAAAGPFSNLLVALPLAIPLPVDPGLTETEEDAHEMESRARMDAERNGCPGGSDDGRSPYGHADRNRDLWD